MQLRINNSDVEAKCPSDTVLMYFLRNDLRLTGARYGCGVGECGSCMVLMDSKAVPSCRLTLADACGRAIETVEGLTSAVTAHPMERALLEMDAGQCGYCYSALVVAVEALKRSGVTADEPKLAELLDRHLCRCGAHQRIIRAARQALLSV